MSDTDNDGSSFTGSYLEHHRDVVEWDCPDVLPETSERHLVAKSQYDR